MATENLDMDYSKYDFKDSTEMYVHLSKKGLTKDTVREISQLKEEPEWMLDFRLRSYDIFMKKPMPQWGGDLNKIDFQKDLSEKVLMHHFVEQSLSFQPHLIL